ncbi:MAG: DsrE family protein [Acidiferrobacteraceae bacterium]
MSRTLRLAVVVCCVLAVSLSTANAQTPSFPGVPAIPPRKGLDFHGFFKRHHPVKLVFGVSDPGAQMKETLTNAALIIQYLRPRSYSYKIQVVLYGKAVLAVDSWRQRYSVYYDLVKSLHAAGVQFRVCYNSMVTEHVKVGDLYSFVKVVPAGLLQIAKKHMEGYTVLQNP